MPDYTFNPLSFTMLTGLPMKFDEGMSDTEILGACVAKINEVGENVANFLQLLASKESSDNLSKNRKLSLLGNFTGKWNGKTEPEMEQLITQNYSLYQMVINAINTGVPIDRISSGGFYLDTDSYIIESGGTY